VVQIYFEEEPARRAAAKLLTRDETLPIAVNNREAACWAAARPGYVRHWS